MKSLVVVCLLALALAPVAGARHRQPRAARILQVPTRSWICPETPDGRLVVSRDICFIEDWPEPTL